MEQYLHFYSVMSVFLQDAFLKPTPMSPTLGTEGMCASFLDSGGPCIAKPPVQLLGWEEGEE